MKRRSRKKKHNITWLRHKLAHCSRNNFTYETEVKSHRFFFFFSFFFDEKEKNKIISLCSHENEMRKKNRLQNHTLIGYFDCFCFDYTTIRLHGLQLQLQLQLWTTVSTAVRTVAVFFFLTKSVYVGKNFHMDVCFVSFRFFFCSSLLSFYSILLNWITLSRSSHSILFFLEIFQFYSLSIMYKLITFRLLYAIKLRRSRWYSRSMELWL